MNTYPLTISSPDGELFRGEVRELILRGTEGDLAILAGHIPFVTGVIRGRCAVVTGDGDRKEGTIEEGILTVTAESVTVLTSGLTFE